MFLKVVEFRAFCQIFVRWSKQVTSVLDCVLSCSDQYYSNFVKELGERTGHNYFNWYTIFVVGKIILTLVC